MAVMLSLQAACASEGRLPEGLSGWVDEKARFADIHRNPDAYRGTVLLAGGQVLSATRQPGGILIAVRQMPLSAGFVPMEPENSKGQFLAVDDRRRIIDPAIFAEHDMVTLAGEVIGTSRASGAAALPMVAITYVTVWQDQRPWPHYGYMPPDAWIKN